jgi:hypothetical protein
VRLYFAAHVRTHNMVMESDAGHSDQKKLEGISAMYNLKIDVTCLSETSGPKQFLQCTV